VQLFARHKRILRLHVNAAPLARCAFSLNCSAARPTDRLHRRRTKD
jgi:hypothetical protein